VYKHFGKSQFQLKLVGYDLASERMIGIFQVPLPSSGHRIRLRNRRPGFKSQQCMYRAEGKHSNADDDLNMYALFVCGKVK
jgi:hypothetical protein